MVRQWIDYTALKSQAGFLPILGHYGIKATRRASGSVKVLCPFHDDAHPSLSVDLTPGQGKFQCFSCGERGNILDFVQKMDGSELRDAAELVAQLNDVPLPTKEQPARGQKRADTGAERQKTTDTPSRPKTPRQRPPVRSEQETEEQERVNLPLSFALKLDASHPYLEQRGLSPELAETFGLGVASKGMMNGRLCIPIHNEDAELIAYAGRWTLDEPLPEGEEKYKLPPKFKKSQVLFNLHRAVALHAHEQGDNLVVVTEGYFGTIRLHALGVPAVALMGTSLSDDQLRLLDAALSPERVVLLFDGDEPGKKAAAETVLPKLAARFYVRNATVLLEDGQQPDELEDNQLLSLVLR